VRENQECSETIINFHMNGRKGEDGLNWRESAEALSVESGKDSLQDKERRVSKVSPQDYL
jgi:hypothetical protein